MPDLPALGFRDQFRVAAFQPWEKQGRFAAEDGRGHAIQGGDGGGHRQAVMIEVRHDLAKKGYFIESQMLNDGQDIVALLTIVTQQNPVV